MIDPFNGKKKRTSVMSVGRSVHAALADWKFSCLSRASINYSDNWKLPQLGLDSIIYDSHPRVGFFEHIGRSQVWALVPFRTLG